MQGRRGQRTVVAVVACLALLGLAGCSSSEAGGPVTVDDAGSSGPQALAGLDGYVTVPGEPLGPATQTVTQADGQPWSFDEVPEGGITLLYFGYTSCPDVCPLTMADVASALNGLPAEVADKITVRFVSTDPHRDTRAQLRSWLGGFDPDFIGARAPIGRVISAAGAYGITIKKPDVTPGNYEVTHGAKILVLGPGGGAVGYFRDTVGADVYRQALPTLVQEYA